MRGPWSVLGVAVLAQLGVSIVDQGLPTLNGFVKADLHLSAAVGGLAARIPRGIEVLNPQAAFAARR